ncbi:MAG TPA: prepilin-type N-terminal cleavage/methylation domain-containing protein [Acidobacteriota bacterium]|nr:prepilin-type N-terminal cleavage/methylation domain-containing protein [Acidobacteriota bacterium]
MSIQRHFRHHLCQVSPRSTRGFTLLELAITISLMMILAAIAVPVYQSLVHRAKETVLHDTLFKLRDSIDKYTNHKEAAPATLQDLVTAKYLREVPIDPITGRNDTWTVKLEEEASSRDGKIGIRDVFSGAEGISSEGTPYAEW